MSTGTNDNKKTSYEVFMGITPSNISAKTSPHH